ncbi:hypothetical protein GOV09_01940 [Candidatus Woesearchaeota archaeon]|nr:hypothetical protein [Candidatus Woesearchaeota archaeon]
MIKYFCSYKELIDYGRKIVDDFDDRDYYKSKMADWEKRCKKLTAFLEKFQGITLFELSQAELSKLYHEFDDIYLEWWAFAQVAEPIAYFCEEELKKLAPKQQDFNLLASPTKSSFTGEEEHELFEIVKQAQQGDVTSLLVNHAKKYFWLENNFHDTRILGASYFEEKVKKFLDDGVDVEKLEKENLKRLTETKQKKTALMDSLNLDGESRFIVELIDEFAYFQDVRKKIVLWSNHVLDSFVKEISRRFTIPYDDVAWLTAPLAKELLKTGKVDLEYVKSLKHSFVIYRIDGRVELFSGKEAEKHHEKFFSSDAQEVREIEGMVACEGRAKGKVRVIVDPKEMNTMQEGEILVTTMTSPDFVRAMKKAAAIITDEGGVTSHASIVSRELGVPCVIGTKIATKVLKTGDIVDVYANHGLIKVVRRKK